MAADTNVEDILAIDSSLIPPGFTHGLQIAIPQSPSQLEDTFQQQSEKLQSQSRPPQQQQKFQQQPRPLPPQYQQRPLQRQQPQQSQQQRLQQRPQPIPLQGPPQPPQQSEQLQVQQQSNLRPKQKERQPPPIRRKGNSFCTWVRKKLWCIRGNSPMEPTLSDELAEGVLKRGSGKTVTGNGPQATSVDLKKSVHDLSDHSDQMSTVGRSGSIGSNRSEKSETEGGKVKLKDRQVTFSDTVRTHIKTKYVTAEEYKQIRGMNAATGRIMYQLVKMRDGDDHLKDKVNPFAGNATRCKRRKPIQ